MGGRIAATKKGSLPFDHSNDPFFAKKVKSAKLIFKKYGLAEKINRATTPVKEKCS
jgi:hypothetical protein